MPASSGLVERQITWGSGFANSMRLIGTIPLVDLRAEFRGATGTSSNLFDVTADHQPTSLTWYRLLVRWVPAATLAGLAIQGWRLSATGYNDPAGMTAFLTWALAGNQFRFYPDPDGAPGTFALCTLASGTDVTSTLGTAQPDGGYPAASLPWKGYSLVFNTAAPITEV